MQLAYGAFSSSAQIVNTVIVIVTWLLKVIWLDMQWSHDDVQKKQLSFKHVDSETCVHG